MLYQDSANIQNQMNVIALYIYVKSSTGFVHIDAAAQQVQIQQGINFSVPLADLQFMQPLRIFCNTLLVKPCRIHH